MEADDGDADGSVSDADRRDTRDVVPEVAVTAALVAAEVRATGVVRAAEHLVAPMRLE